MCVVCSTFFVLKFNDNAVNEFLSSRAVEETKDTCAGCGGREDEDDKEGDTKPKRRREDKEEGRRECIYFVLVAKEGNSSMCVIRFHRGFNYVTKLRHVYFRLAKSRENAGGIMAQQTRTPITTTNSIPSSKPSTYKSFFHQA